MTLNATTRKRTKGMNMGTLMMYRIVLYRIVSCFKVGARQPEELERVGLEQFCFDIVRQAAVALNQLAGLQLAQRERVIGAQHHAILANHLD